MLTNFINSLNEKLEILETEYTEDKYAQGMVKAFENMENTGEYSVRDYEELYMDISQFIDADKG